MIDELALPVRNALARGSDFAVAGSLLRADVARRPPRDLRPPERGGRVPGRGARLRHRRCRGPSSSAACWRATPRPTQDVLLSGWIRGPEAIARKAAAVALTYGKGKVVLLGFRPQHRAQTPGHLPVPVRRALLVDGEVVFPPRGGEARGGVDARCSSSSGPWRRASGSRRTRRRRRPRLAGSVATDAEQEAFLKEAKVVKTRAAGGGGITGALRATLRLGELQHDALVQSIDEEKPYMDLAARPRAGVPRQLQEQRRRVSPGSPARPGHGPGHRGARQHDGKTRQLHLVGGRRPDGRAGAAREEDRASPTPSAGTARCGWSASSTS